MDGAWPRPDGWPRHRHPGWRRAGGAGCSGGRREGFHELHGSCHHRVQHAWRRDQRYPERCIQEWDRRRDVLFGHDDVRHDAAPRPPDRPVLCTDHQSVGADAQRFWRWHPWLDPWSIWWRLEDRRPGSGRRASILDTELRAEIREWRRWARLGDGWGAWGRDRPPGAAITGLQQR